MVTQPFRCPPETSSRPGGRRRRVDPLRRAEAIAGLAVIEASLRHMDPHALLLDLASRGLLADTAAVAPPEVRTVLSGATFEVAMPVVFERVTRGVERRRGHHRCATALNRLAETCLDGFTEDMDAVVADVLDHADIAIRDLPAWIASRAMRATVDANRARRGARGALQRPRVPQWLVAKLRGDAWLVELARLILLWVGVPAAAGAVLWPLDAWSRLRSETVGGPADWAAAQRDVDRVIAAMRSRPEWHQAYVERPLGFKQIAVATIVPGIEPVPFVFASPDDLREARRLELASSALEAIEARLSGGGDPLAVVAEVVRTVFADDHSDLDDLPHAGSGEQARIEALLADDAELVRIARTVLDILGRVGAPA